jgi:LysR family transcriptional activator of nhaA
MARVDWLNYHHLFYFSAIVHEGGVAPAARKLRLTHSTLSAQLRSLEDHFGAALFERRGRRLVPTAFGLEAAGYADDIFRLGRELMDVARGRGKPGRDILRVGVVPGLPKTLVHRLLGPALDQSARATAIVRQDTAEPLIESLAAGRLHVVLTNDVPPAIPAARLRSQALGETEILLYARGRVARAARRGFPRSLEGRPFVLPPPAAPLRRQLDAWFADRDVRVAVSIEVEDAGLLRAFGGAGRGVFPVRAALAAEVEDLRDVAMVGRCDGLRERYYAVTADRRTKHPAVAAIIERGPAYLHPVKVNG